MTTMTSLFKHCLRLVFVSDGVGVRSVERCDLVKTKQVNKFLCFVFLFTFLALGLHQKKKKKHFFSAG